MRVDLEEQGIKDNFSEIYSRIRLDLKVHMTLFPAVNRAWNKSVMENTPVKVPNQTQGDQVSGIFEHFC